ncbi:hypothetical protein OsJ_35022 [Oryza sativa Japonica Group]|uniref:Uncharacterized protein n=2 Tax=Oryza sativa subsp. japonica TaxID=39947 RepID=A0A8J8XVN7_ORYSJ|nr:hypothetical protein LOC_Os12g02610 [Oryza sativa Japonica Group]EAZ19459.1 hypothetical protein OsJ_35022 [Oryza sativa Japonica Group]
MGWDGMGWNESTFMGVWLRSEWDGLVPGEEYSSQIRDQPIRENVADELVPPGTSERRDDAFLPCSRCSPSGAAADGSCDSGRLGDGDHAGLGNDDRGGGGVWRRRIQWWGGRWRWIRRWGGLRRRIQRWGGAAADSATGRSGGGMRGGGRGAAADSAMGTVAACEEELAGEERRRCARRRSRGGSRSGDGAAADSAMGRCCSGL